MKMDSRDPDDFTELTGATPVDQPPPSCSVCGTKLPTGDPTCLCPVCLLRGALKPDSIEEGLTSERDLTEFATGTGKFDPKRFEHYEILASPEGNLVELGRGAMGITFKALDLNLRIPVTLKVLNLRSFEDEQARRRFLREARAAASVRHPNVASVYHLGARGRDIFYAMEFVEGETLECLIKRSGPLEVKLALEITTQVAAGLAAVHKQNLVHRDIKPSNIMVSLTEESRYSAKVIDLGLAKAVDEPHPETMISMRGTFAGTPEYASPEQFAGVGVDIRSDLYSLGVTLWKMLTGKTPYRGTAASVMHQHQYTPLPFEQLTGIPQPVVTVLQMILEKDPARRFQSPTELLKVMPVVSGAVETGRTISRAMLRNAPDSRPMRVQKVTVKLSEHDLYLRGMALLDLNDRGANQKAIKLFKKAIKQDPNCASAYAGLAQAYVQEEAAGGDKSSLDLAVEAARMAIALSPSEPSAQHSLGRAYYALVRAYFLKGWDPQCDKALEVALEMLPDDDWINGIAALRALARHQFPEAFRFFWKAMSLNPGITLRVYIAAEIIFRAGINDIADKWMQQALDRETNPQTHRMMQCYRMMWRRKFAAARVGFAQLPPKLQSGSYSVADGLLHCTIGLGDWPAVIESCNAYLKGDPDKLWPRTYLAIALQRSGREVEAREIVEQILECGLERLERPGQPDIPWEITLHVAWACRYLGRNDESDRYLNKYLAHRTLIQIPLGFDNPILDGFRGDPDFESIMADLSQKFEVASRLIQQEESRLISGQGV